MKSARLLCEHGGIYTRMSKNKAQNDYLNNVSCQNEIWQNELGLFSSGRATLSLSSSQEHSTWRGQIGWDSFLWQIVFQINISSHFLRNTNANRKYPPLIYEQDLFSDLTKVETLSDTFQKVERIIEKLMAQFFPSGDFIKSIIMDSTQTSYEGEAHFP